MKKRFRKGMAAVLIIAMVISMVAVSSVSVGAYSNNYMISSATTFDYLRQKYPHNTQWNSTFNNGQAIQCHGFALQLGYELTDISPYSWSKRTDVSNYIASGSLKPGDIIRAYGDGHTIMVTNVNGSAINFVDCNWIDYGRRSNVIRWDGYATISNNSTLSTFGYINYVLSCPKNVVDVPAVANPWITVNKEYMMSGDTITFNLGAENAVSYTIGIDKDGSRIITEGVGTSPSYQFSEPGIYSAYVTAYDSMGRHADSGTVWFRVMKPENLGDSFYGLILNTDHWKPIGGSEDGNVELQTEAGVASQVWRFERQADNSYKIILTKNGQCLDLVNFVTDNGNNIQLCADNGTNAQRWYICSKDNGYNIVSKCSAKSVMDLNGNIADDGTNIQIYEYNGTPAQKFSIYRLVDDVYLNAPTLSADAQNYKKVQLSWNDVYGENGYTIKIWKNSADEGEPFYTASDIAENTVSKEIQLPVGDYEAYIEAYNHFDSRKSNVVSFTITEPELIIGDVNGDLIINEDDVTLLTVKFNYGELTERQKLVGDANQDGRVNMLDVDVISNYISGQTVEYVGKLLIDVRKYTDLIIGDVNGDLIVDRDDVNLSMEKLTKGTLADRQKLVADANQDGRVNISDATAIMRYLSGKTVQYVGELLIDVKKLSGDANCDGTVNLLDAVMAQKAALSMTTLDEQGIANADMNGDGKITLFDAIAIQRLTLSVS